jgi:FAD/FMN-containing dehydrogenase
MARYSKTYQNWSENLSHPTPIHYPTDNAEIINLIMTAQNANQKIRVVGAAHSSSPVITQASTSDDIILISLAKYELEPEDIKIDADEMTVKVNAGWTLAQLYDELNKGLYFLETQTAGAAFTVGGVISTPVHGGRLGGSLMADSVLAITMIDSQYNIIERKASDPDFDYYRLNLGLSGIIISVTFRIHQMLNVQSNIYTHHDAFIWKKNRPRLNNLALSGFFWDRISYCLNGPALMSPTISRKVRPNRMNRSTQRTQELDEPSRDSIVIPEGFDVSQYHEIGLHHEDLEGGGDLKGKQIYHGATSKTVLKKRARYTHCFMDFHNNSMTSLDWIERKHVRGVRFNRPESTFIPKVSNRLHRIFFPRYRQRHNYLKLMGHFVRVNIENSVRLNQLDDQDMLWVSLGTQVYFMSYYIPVYTEGDFFDFDRVAQPFEIIMELVAQFKNENRAFNIDFPLDFRFVTSSSATRASPIYSPENSPRTVYLALDLTCGPSNISLNGTKIKPSGTRTKDFIRRLNADFHEFYTTVEKRWRELGGIPHWGKLFGFSTNPKHPEPINPRMVRKIFAPGRSSLY